MSIENPQAFILLTALLPIVIVYFFLYRYGIKDLRAISHGQAEERLSEVYFRKFFFSALMFCLTFVFLTLTLADFKWKKEYVTEHATGVDIVVAVDVSNSMLADDLLPGRLERVKRVVSMMAENRAHFRYSLVAFKGGAVRLVPMTEDVSGFRSCVEALSPGLITTAGTSIHLGLERAIESFPPGKETRKMIILFSDGGEDNLKGGGRVESLLQEKKIRLITVGCGTDAGGVIRLDKDRVMLDSEGLPKKVSLNREMLRALTLSVGGDYLDLNDPAAIHNLEEIIEGESGWVGVIDHSIRRPSQYRLFLMLALASLALYVFVRAKKVKGIF